MGKFLIILVCGCLLGSDVWVAKINGTPILEASFYNYIPKGEWLGISEKNKKEKLFFGFLKQQAAVLGAKKIGLQYDIETTNKLNARFNMMLVNEYYMRYFLGTVTPHFALSFCKQNLKNELYVKHILLKRSERDVEMLANAIKDSIVVGGNFSTFALRYSDDPGVSANEGLLGWVSLGQTVPEFQDGIFSLCVGCLGVVETEFGFHVVKVDSVRQSRYGLLEQDMYDDYAFRFATAYIKEPLKDLAANHDSLLVSQHGVRFNEAALLELVNLIKLEQERPANKTRKDVDVVSILQNYQKVVLEYDGNLLSGAWFAHKINSSLHKSVFYTSLAEIKKDFTTIVLRDIAFNLSLDLGLQFGSTFKSQYENIKAGVLERAFLKDLMGSVSLPSQQEVEDYFLKNKKHNQTLEVAYSSIEAILLQEKQKKKKEDFLVGIEKQKNIIINDGWLYGD